MRTQILISSADVEKLKQKARQVKKDNSIPHHEALDQVAQAAGFNHWHHVSESAKAFKPSEQAYYFGVIIALDIKDAMDFRDSSGTFIEDEFAFALCANDLYEDLCESEEDEGVPVREQYSEAELKEWAEEDLSNYGFFRYAGSDVPDRVEQVVEMVRKCSFWPPIFIWHKGVFQRSPSDDAVDEDGRIVGVRF